MSVSDDLRKYLRFATGLKKFLAAPISLAASRAVVSQRLEQREGLFLELVEKVVYGSATSPYLELLKIAGYELADLRRLVERVGLEQALRDLVEDGVYLTFDEFKGRKPVVRGGKEFAFAESDFDNPFLSCSFGVETGGTQSAGTRTMIDFDFLSQEAIHRALALDVHGLLEAPAVLWYPILPGNAGIMNIFRQAKISRPAARWFSQVDARSIRPSLKDRLGTSFIVYMGRLFGSRICKPEYVDLGRADKVAECVADLVKEHSACTIWTYVNSAVRTCTAAREAGLCLDGARFFVSGEPITDTKLREIRSSGAEGVPYYAFVEGGITAYGCANPSAPDDMHLLSDRMAVVTHQKVLPSEETVDSLLFTALLPEAPKILLNVETGDHAAIGPRQCGCGFEAYGYPDHMSGIKSFEKFTSEGMTFMAADLMHVAEEILPAEYGGSSSDYQFTEESQEDGMTFVSLAVSPRLGPIPESELVETVVEALGKTKGSDRMMATMWSQAGTIRVRRAEPIPTKRGKIFSFRAGRK